LTGRQASAGTLRSCTPAPARLSSHQSLPTGTVPTRCHVCSSCAPSHPVLLLHDAVTSPCEKNGPLLPVKNRGIHYAAFTMLSCKVTSLGSEYRAKSGKYSPPMRHCPMSPLRRVRSGPYGTSRHSAQSHRESVRRRSIRPLILPAGAGAGTAKGADAVIGMRGQHPENIVTLHVLLLMLLIVLQHLPP